MTVILDTTRVGMGWIQPEGSTVDLPDHEAIALVNSGQARFVETTVETGMIDNRKLETASMRRGRKRYGS